MTKSIFIDFDGTLAHEGRVPPAHLEALSRARTAGHRVFLCTGRPRVLMPRRFRESVFDGLVCTAGGYVEVAGEVLADVRYPSDLAAKTAEVLEEQGTTFVLEAAEALFTSPRSVERLHDLLGGALIDTQEPDGPGMLLSALQASDELSGCSFGKASVFDSPITVAELAVLIGPEVGSLPNSVTGVSGHAGELYLRGIDKSLGVATVEAHLGLDRADIVAIGDGLNDLEMLDYAGIGVAVEGSPAEVLAVAQHVIPGPAEHGIARGFADLGLL